MMNSHLQDCLHITVAKQLLEFIHSQGGTDRYQKQFFESLVAFHLQTHKRKLLNRFEPRCE